MTAVTSVQELRDRDVAPGFPRWHAHDLNRASLYRLASLTAAALPRALRLRVATGLATRLRGRFVAERAAVGASLARMLPGATEGRRAALVDEVFRHFAMCFTDLVTSNRGPALAGLLGGVDGAHHLDAALEAGRGAVVLTAHVGNWELGGRLMARQAERVTHVVMAEESDPAIEALLRVDSPLLRFVVCREPRSALSLLSALRRGELVAMQGDRALGTRGDARVPFFGAPAAFPLGPFVLARAAGAAVVPAFCLLERDRRYRITLGSPIIVGADAPLTGLARWVGMLESVVGQHPEQWFNFFDFWSVGADA